MEIGGYFGLENDPTREEYHTNALRFNLARSALEFVLINRHIKKLYVPFYSCETVFNAVNNAHVELCCYSLDADMTPSICGKLNDGEYLYITNYFGQLSNNDISELKALYHNIIVDNVQSFFQMPIDDVDTIYSCRKYFGVPNGAYLYTSNQQMIDNYDKLEYAVDEACYTHITGRIDTNASDHYAESIKHEQQLCCSGLKKMPLSTQLMLSNINYNYVRTVRVANFNILHNSLAKFNRLDVKNNGGAFFYPFYINNGNQLRNLMISHKVYIPTLWPNVKQSSNAQAMDFANNIVYIPIDQRYGDNEMNFILDMVVNYYDGL